MKFNLEVKKKEETAIKSLLSKIRTGCYDERSHFDVDHDQQPLLTCTPILVILWRP